MSGVFCTNNAQASSLFSNVTIWLKKGTVARNCFNIRSTSCVCLLVLRWKRGRELVHCLYKKLQKCLPTSRRPGKPYFFFILRKPFLSIAINKKVKFDGGGALFRHFCISKLKVITTAHAHKSGVIFHFFQELSSKKIKIKIKIKN